MFKRVALIFVVSSILYGCDNGGNTNIIAKESESSNETKADYAIYFSTGAGLNFGKPPISDITKKVNGRDYREVIYILDADLEAAIEAIKEVMKPLGYAARVRTDKSYDAHVMYDKDKSSIETIYTKKASEGFTKQVELKVRWYVE